MPYLTHVQQGVSSNRKTRSEQVVSVFDIFLIILPAAAVFFHLMNYPPDAHQGHIYILCVLLTLAWLFYMQLCKLRAPVLGTG
jgi:hypothetical protein